MKNFTFVVSLLFIAFFSCLAQGQTRMITGTLTDPDTKDPMPGVNVVIKGTATGTVTDSNGNYTLEAPIGSTLVFSFVGYAQKEMLVEPLPMSSLNKNDTVKQKIFRHSIPESPGDKTLSPYFFVKSDNPNVDRMPLKSTSAEVNIAGVIADVRVKQVYINAGKNTLEAIYIFPGSTRAAVYGMSMTIGSRKLIAKIKEKEKARQDYEQAKQAGKTATLLEQKRPNVFQMNVGNIMPGDTITVEMNYTELLVPTEGTYEFVYPTVVGPRYSEIPDNDLHAEERWVENPHHHQGEKPDYTFDFSIRLNSGIPIQKIACPSHQIDVQFEARRKAIIHLGKDETFGGNRDFILRYRLRGGEVESGLLLNPRKDENFFLLMVEPPDAPRPDQIPPREYIFVVDVSGSMQGFPIDVSKTLLRRLIGSLRPIDKFNVLLFESSNQMLNDKSVPATERNINDAIHVLNKQQGGGGTRLYPALQKALSYEKEEGYSRTFVVITDGFVTIEKEAFNLVRKNLNDANLFAIGIGSSVNRYLIEGLAQAGMGEPFIVTNPVEAEATGKRFKDFVEKPVLTNIKIDYGKFDVYDVEPLSIPDVFAERPIIVYGKYRGDATGTISLTGYSGTKVYSKKIELSLATKENNEALRYLWARNKIKYLDDYAQYYEDNNNGYDKSNNTASRIEEVTNLGLTYNLLTQYTSFIAVDSMVRNENQKSEKVKQPLPLPLGVTDMALAGRVSGVTLQPDVQALNEIVVVGYGTQSKRDVTYSITTISSESIELNSISVNNALEGKVAGVVVNQNSGSPGGNTSVRIRGNSSIALNNTPLYVIDGVPVDNTDRPTGTAGTDAPDRLTDINPNDIESIEVLKSISANAIYGSRGANGVILISTKKPKSGKQKISYTSTFSVQKVNKLPELQHSFAQGRSAGGNLQWQGAETSEIYSWGPSSKALEFDGNVYPYDRNGKLVPLALGNGSPSHTYDQYGLFKTGSTFDNHLSVSKATEKTKYNFSIGHTAQNGVIPGSGYKRTTGRLSFEKLCVQKIRLGTDLNLSTSSSDLIQRGNSGSSVMYDVLTTPPTFDNGNGLIGKNALSNSGSYLLPDNTPRSFAGGLIDNPYWNIKKNTSRAMVNRIIPSVYTEYNAARWLSLTYKISGDVYEDNLISGYDTYSAAAPSGRFFKRKETYSSLNSEFIINGKKNMLNDNLTVTAVAGLVNFFSQRAISHTEGTGLNKAGVFRADNAGEVIRSGGQYGIHNTRVLTKLNLQYQQFLSLDLLSVEENTSTLSRLHKHINSQGAGLAFTFTELPFADLSNSVLRSGKIFANLGKIQKEAPLFIDPNFYYASTTGVSTSILFAERMNINSNINLKAEQSNTVEVGTSLGFMDNRISLNASYYRGNTTNAFVPTYVGPTVLIRNGAVLNNSGIDLSLNATPLRNNITWNIGLNFTKYKSIVKSLPGGIDQIALAGFNSISSSLIAGQPYGVLYGTRYLRNENGQVVIGNDGFPLVDANKGVLGNPNPDWMMGVNNTFSLKNLSLAFLVDIRKGGAIWNGTRNTLHYYGVSKNTALLRETKNYVFNGVTEEGQVNTKAVDFFDPSKNVSENRWVRYGTTGVAEDAIEDGGWVRLRQVALTYRFSSTLVSKVRLKNMSVSFITNNLFLFTKYSGIDPETNLTGNSNGRGLDYFNLPNTKSYSISLKVGL